MQIGFNDKFNKAYEKSSAILSESIANVRTVASLTLEDVFSAKFFSALAAPYRAGTHVYAIAITGTGIRWSIFMGIGLGISEGAVYFVYALAYWFVYEVTLYLLP